MEQGAGRLAVPQQRVSVDLQPVLLGEPKQRLCRGEMDRNRSLVACFLHQFLAFGHVQHGIRLHLVFGCQDAELAQHQPLPFGVVKCGLRHSGTEVKLVCIDFLQAGYVLCLFNDHRRLGRLRLRLPFRGNYRKVPDFKIQRFRAGGLHIQHAAVKSARGIASLQRRPLALFGGAESEVFIGFRAVNGMGDRNHEICAVQDLLLHLNAQVVLPVLDQVKIPSGGIPVAHAAGGHQRVFLRPERLGSPAVPSVLILTEIGSINGLRPVGSRAYAAAQQAKSGQHCQNPFHRVRHPLRTVVRFVRTYFISSFIRFQEEFPAGPCHPECCKGSFSPLKRTALAGGPENLG